MGAEERTGVEDSGFADDVIFGGEGVAAEEVVVLLFLEQFVDEFFVVAVGDDDFFLGEFDFAHDAKAAEAEVIAVAHEAGAVVIAVAPDEDAADAGNHVQNVAATDIATVDDAFNGGGGEDFDGGGNSVCPSVGIAYDPQHLIFFSKKQGGHSRQILKNARESRAAERTRMKADQSFKRIAAEINKCCLLIIGGGGGVGPDELEQFIGVEGDFFPAGLGGLSQLAG